MNKNSSQDSDIVILQSKYEKLNSEQSQQNPNNLETNNRYLEYQKKYQYENPTYKNKNIEQYYVRNVIKNTCHNFKKSSTCEPKKKSKKINILQKSIQPDQKKNRQNQLQQMQIFDNDNYYNITLNYEKQNAHKNKVKLKPLSTQITPRKKDIQQIEQKIESLSKSPGSKLNKLRIQKFQIEQQNNLIKANINYLQHDQKIAQKSLQKIKGEAILLNKNQKNREQQIEDRQFYHLLKFKGLKDKQQYVQEQKRENKQKLKQKQQEIFEKNIKTVQRFRTTSLQINDIIQHRQKCELENLKLSVKSQIQKEQQQIKQKKIKFLKKIEIGKLNYEQKTSEATKQLQLTKKIQKDLEKTQKQVNTKVQNYKNRSHTHYNKFQNIVQEIKTSRIKVNKDNFNISLQSNRSTKNSKDLLYFGYTQDIIEYVHSKEFRQWEKQKERQDQLKRISNRTSYSLQRDKNLQKKKDMKDLVSTTSQSFYNDQNKQFLNKNSNKNRGFSSDEKDTILSYFLKHQNENTVSQENLQFNQQGEQQKQKISQKNLYNEIKELQSKESDNYQGEKDNTQVVNNFIQNKEDHNKNKKDSEKQEEDLEQQLSQLQSSQIQEEEILANQQ